MTETQSSILEGVDENTPRSELLKRLRAAADDLFKRDDARVSRMQEIEEDVRRRWSGREANLVQIIATSTEEEWGDAVDFLANFDDIIPVALFRVYDGARSALGRDTDSPDTDSPDEAPGSGGGV